MPMSSSHAVQSSTSSSDAPFDGSQDGGAADAYIASRNQATWGKPLFVNCGGATVVDKLGNSWQSDASFMPLTQGTVNTQSVRLTGGAAVMYDSLPHVQSARMQPRKETAAMVFNLPADDNFVFTVSVYFVDGSAKTQSSGKRVFDVQVETDPEKGNGNRWATDGFDIFAAAGQFGLATLTFRNVQPANGNIKLELTPQSYNGAMVSAVEVSAVAVARADGMVNVNGMLKEATSIFPSIAALDSSGEEVGSSSNIDGDTDGGGNNSADPANTIGIAGAVPPADEDSSVIASADDVSGDSAVLDDSTSLNSLLTTSSKKADGPTIFIASAGVFIFVAGLLIAWKCGLCGNVGNDDADGSKYGSNPMSPGQHWHAYLPQHMQKHGFGTYGQQPELIAIPRGGGGGGDGGGDGDDMQWPDAASDSDEDTVETEDPLAHESETYDSYRGFNQFMEGIGNQRGSGDSAVPEGSAEGQRASGPPRGPPGQYRSKQDIRGQLAAAAAAAAGERGHHGSANQSLHAPSASSMQQQQQQARFQKRVSQKGMLAGQNQRSRSSARFVSGADTINTDMIAKVTEQQLWFDQALQHQQHQQRSPGMRPAQGGKIPSPHFTPDGSQEAYLHIPPSSPEASHLMTAMPDLASRWDSEAINQWGERMHNDDDDDDADNIDDDGHMSVHSDGSSTMAGLSPLIVEMMEVENAAKKRQKQLSLSKGGGHRSQPGFKPKRPFHTAESAQPPSVAEEEEEEEEEVVGVGGGEEGAWDVANAGAAAAQPKSATAKLDRMPTGTGGGDHDVSEEPLYRPIYEPLPTGNIDQAGSHSGGADLDDNNGGEVVNKVVTSHQSLATEVARAAAAAPMVVDEEDGAASSLAGGGSTGRRARRRRSIHSRWTSRNVIDIAVGRRRRGFCRRRRSSSSRRRR